MGNSTFHDMSTALKDGTSIEVKQGPKQEIVVAECSEQVQDWILADDPHRKMLHWVTGWRRVKQSRAI